MEFTNMSLVELKAVAKEKRIKHYYIMKRAQLIDILSLPELPVSFRIEKMSVRELYAEAKRRGIRGFWEMPRERLVELLFPDQHHPRQTTPNKQEENKGNTDEHHPPQEHTTEEIRVEDLENA